MKKWIAMLLAAAAVCMLLAGCEFVIENPDPNPAEPTEYLPSPLNPEDVNQAADELGVDLNNLDDQALKDLQDKLTRPDLTLGEDNSLEIALPEGVTKPPVTTTLPPPTTMPKGAAAKNSEVYPYVKKVIETLQTGKFYLKGYGSTASADMQLAFDVPATEYAPIHIAADGKQMIFEHELDWVAMLKATSEGNDFGSSTAIGLTMQTAYGKKMRILFNNEGTYIVFPEKKKYTSLPELMGAQANVLPDTSEMTGSVFGEVNSANLDNLESSKVTADGKEYLCATMAAGENAYVKMYFLNGELKRLENISSSDEGEITSIIDVDEFHGSPAASLFSISGMSKVLLAEFGKMMGG